MITSINMRDFSFIRLEPDFAKAKTESLPAVANIGYFDQIQLHPEETYLQITNTVDGIAFDGNFAVYIIDSCGTVKKDITDNVAIFEFTDNNGLPQIAFEIAYINTDYYKERLFLKFVHTVSDYVWYSNALTITAYQLEETTRFDYTGFTDFYGVAYNRAPYFQSIRLRCYYAGNDTESTSTGYTSINGQKVTSRVIQSEFEKYVFERVDTFAYRRLNKLLTNQVIYVNGNRITDKQTIQSEDFTGNTNIFNVDFKCCINYDDTYTAVFQIHEPLTLIDYSPFGNYTLAGLPTDIIGQYNRNVTEQTGQVQLIDTSDNSVIATFTQAELITTLNEFKAGIIGLIVSNGVYKITVSEGLFISFLGEINPSFEWTFTVSNADYSSAHYTNDYFIN